MIMMMCGLLNPPERVIMSNKKRFITLGLVALSSLVLSGCDEVRSRPDNYEDPLVGGGGTDGISDSVFDNVMSVIYDAFDDVSKTTTFVFEQVMKTFAEEKFGKFDDALAAQTAGSASETFEDFVAAHSFYTNNIDEEMSDADKVQVQFNRLNQFIEEVNHRVNEKLLNEIGNSSYAKDGVFCEAKYARSLKTRLFAIEGDFADADEWYEEVIIPAIKADDIDGLLIHRDRYAAYINERLIPAVYSERLTEQYIYDEIYSTIGRSSARKINYVSIGANSDSPLAADYLVDEFVEQNIIAGDGGAGANLEILANAWRGVPEDFTPTGNADETYEDKLLTSPAIANIFTKDQTNPEAVHYKSTTFGDLVSRYNKITDNPYTTDKAIESEFTNANSYMKEIGLKIKTNEVRKSDHTTDGWFIRNGGLSGVPSDMRSRLFNIGVANALDTSEPLEDSPYIREINGRFYLTPNFSEDRERDIRWFDLDSKTYYIFEVEEAVSAAKMTTSSDTSYTSIYADLGVKQEVVGMAVAKILAETNAAHKKSAQSFYLKGMELQYYDQKVYDYFMDNWPELFE